MADQGGLQLLPETRRKIEIRVPGENKMLSIGVITLVVVLVIIGGLYFYKTYQEGTLSSLDDQIATLEKQRNRQAEQNLLVLNKQLALLSNLLGNHIYWSLGFSKVEGLLENQVQFETLTTSLADNKIDFKALAPNYTTIAKQIASFLSDSSVQDVNLDKVTATTTGRLEFSMKISFDRNKFLLK